MKKIMTITLFWLIVLATQPAFSATTAYNCSGQSFVSPGFVWAAELRLKASGAFKLIDIVALEDGTISGPFITKGTFTIDPSTGIVTFGATLPIEALPVMDGQGLLLDYTAPGVLFTGQCWGK